MDKYLNKITCIDALELLADLPDDSVDIARDRVQRANPYIATENKDGTKQLSLFEGLDT